jgi:hypothetical protein
MSYFLRRFALVSIAMAVLGGGIRVARWIFTTRDAPEVLDYRPITMPATPSCFPGKSVEVSHLRSAKNSLIRETTRLFSAEWFSQELRAMNEPSILSLDPTSEVYRFLWLRSFHHPVAVRVWRTRDEYFMSAIEMSAAASRAGKGFKRTSRRLTPEEWFTLTDKLEELCFWTFEDDQRVRANDGAEWIMEGLSEGRYHLIDVQSPTVGSYRDACLYFLKISDLGYDEKSKEIY